MGSLNGRKMQLGDVVYDVLLGTGQVVNDGGGELMVTVDFGKRGRMNFAQDGTFNGQQRLYWREPYILQPTGPNDEAYEMTMGLVDVIYNYFKAYETRKGNRS